MKRKADNLVKSGTNINYPKEFCAALRQEETAFTVLEVSREDISESRNIIESWKTPAVTGILMSHAVVPAEGKIYTRETSCYSSCCYTPAQLFHPVCQGWPAVTQASEVNRQENIDGKIEFKVGSFLAVVYGRRRYIAEVSNVNENGVEVCYMAPSGKRGRWPIRKEVGQVDQEDVLLLISTPTPDGKFFNIKEKEKIQIESRFKNYND